uniref:Essential MCU regulator, mitochondrial n=1 Tax=Amphimedon queenslandica TaxID=400682 RepID=A0A1X7V803_AMPQE
MASLGLLRKCSSLLLNGSNLALRRTTTTQSGALVSKPIRHYNLVLFRLGFVAIPFVYLGYWAGGQFAEFLEEYEFYIPDDDDDD